MADQTLASFVVKLRHDVDPASAKKFTDTVQGGIQGINSLRLALVGMAVAAEEAIRRTTNNFSQLYYLNRSTGVAAEGIMRLRAQFVGAGMDAKAADSAMGGLAKSLRDPGVVAQVQALVGPIKDSADGIDKMARAYANAVKLSGGREWEGAALALRTQLEAIEGLDFEGVRNLALNIERSDRNAVKLEKLLSGIKLEGGLKAAGERAADMDATFWRLGQTIQFAFAAVITNPAISQAIDDIAEGLAKWIVDPETQKAIQDILTEVSKFLGNKDNMAEFGRTMKAIGQDVLAIAHAFAQIVGFVNQLSDNKAIKEGISERAAGVVGKSAAEALGAGITAPTVQEARKDPNLQIKEGDNFATRAFKWLSTTSIDDLIYGKGNYKHGGIVPSFAAGGIMPANLHAGEMVLPRNISQGLQSLFGGGGGFGGQNALAEEFDRWWSGDSSFAPIVAFASDVYEKLRELLMEFFKTRDEKEDWGPGAGGAGAGGSAADDDGAGAPGGAGGEAPGGGGTSTSLVEDRKRFAEELANNPELRDKVMRIAANEQGQSGRGTQQVIESMMNRASIRGRTLAQEAKWTGEGGYYAQGTMGKGALENAAHRKILEDSLKNALGGGNLANYATDNASQGLAVKDEQLGLFKVAAQSIAGARTGQRGNETFFTPGTANPGDLRRFNEWRARMGGGDGAAPGAPMAEGGGQFIGGGKTRGVNPVLVDTLSKAAQQLGEGYKVFVTSGERASGAGGSQHKHGGALDVQIQTPEGKLLPNRGAFGGGAEYARLAHAWYQVIAKEHPHLKGAAAWGGEFGTQLGGGGEADYMHYDLGGRRGRGRRNDWAYTDNSRTVYQISATDPHGVSRVTEDMRNKKSQQALRYGRTNVS